MNLSKELGIFGTGKVILIAIEGKKDACNKTNRRNQKKLRKMIRAARRSEKIKAIRECIDEME